MTRPKRRGPELPPAEVALLAEAWEGEDVALAAVLDGRPMLVMRATGGMPELWLELELLLANGHEHKVALLMEAVDPYLIAGELQGVADALVAQVLADKGLDAREQQEVLRAERLRARRRREEVAGQVAASGATSCDYCQRSVAFVVEGARLCKRHAEELGVRPHGKVGEPEPGELPEEAEA